jgi:hypothetical protein
MSSDEYLLNFCLLAYILWANLGTRVVTRRRFVIPLVLAGLAGAGYLRHVPTAGNDVTLEVAGIAAGAVFGLMAALLVKVGRNAEGKVTMTAGAPYAAVWVIVIGGRCLFSYGATHWFPQAITAFSIDHRITGAGAWTAAFVLMALTMLVTRVIFGAVQTASVPRYRNPATTASNSFSSSDR